MEEPVDLYSDPCFTGMLGEVLEAHCLKIIKSEILFINTFNTRVKKKKKKVY